MVQKTDTPVLVAKNIAKNFGSASVLKDISFTVSPNERLAILGPGGSGKSTLLKVLIGILEPDNGQVKIFDRDVHKLTKMEKKELLRDAAMAFQQGALFDFMNVKDNIVFAMDNMTSFSKDEQEKKIKEMLLEVDLPHAADKLPSELSGGMKRRVGIVRALATDPKIALFDEPTAGLDPVTTRIVIDMIHRLGEGKDAAMVCVTSAVDVAFSFAKKVAILKDGYILEVGTWEELNKTDNEWLKNFLNVRGFSPYDE